MRLRRFLRDEQGSAATELTLLTPALILMMLFVVLCGRVTQARLHVDDATHQAVRAATLARSAGQARTEARATAEAALGQAGVTCQTLTVDTRLDGFQPGSTVSATVACQVGFADLTALGIPGTAAMTATATSVVDRWRGVSPDGVA